MKAGIFLKELLAKAEVSDEVLLAAAEQLEGELPDNVGDILPNILTPKSAKSNKDITSFFDTKFNERLTKTQVAKLQEAGFSEAEVAEIKKLSPEERLVRVAQIEREKASSVLNTSVDERVASFQKQAQEAEAKALSYQKALLEKDKYYASVIEGVKMETDLNSFLSSIQFRKDGIPRDAALKLVKDELKTALEVAGAQLTFINGFPKLVRRDDNSLDFYDDGNNLVDAGRFIFAIANRLNLVETNPNPAGGVNRNQNTKTNPIIPAGRGTQYDSTSRVSNLLNKIKQS